jgi:glycosyltransferase involved in cell wall biosynthesis
MKVSVCIITYNHERFIEQAINSVLMQRTNFDYEIVIGEDCSTDNTGLICKKYAEMYPDKIRLLQNDKNLGMIENFKRTLYACKGEYVALLEGDDYWTDELKLQKQVDFLESNRDYAVVFHNAEILIEKTGEKYIGYSDEATKPFMIKTPNPTTTLQEIAAGNYIYTATSLFRNNLYNKLPTWFSSDLPAVDWPIHVINAHYGKIFFMDEVMAVYRVHNLGVWSALDDIKRLEKTVKLFEIVYKNLKTKTTLLSIVLFCRQLLKYFVGKREIKKCLYYASELLFYDAFNTIKWFMSLALRICQSHLKLKS